MKYVQNYNKSNIKQHLDGEIPKKGEQGWFRYNNMCLSKKPFFKKRDIKIAISNMRKINNKEYDYYKCPFCHAYHVTTIKA